MPTGRYAQNLRRSMGIVVAFVLCISGGRPCLWSIDHFPACLNVGRCLLFFESEIPQALCSAFRCYQKSGGLPQKFLRNSVPQSPLRSTLYQLRDVWTGDWNSILAFPRSYEEEIVLLPLKNPRSLILEPSQ